jgi:endonuclease/exonuclease/phosphatase family metal-dependent hydrolase
MLKLLSLNIGLYSGYSRLKFGSWEERKASIIQFIKKQNPDVVALQEVMDDAKFNEYGDNQAKQLAKVLRFNHSVVYLSSNLQKESPQWVGDRRAREGNAILSRYPLVGIVKRHLKRQPEDKHYRGIVYARVMAPEPYELMVVHFTNNDAFSVLHLKEVLAYVKRTGSRPIIAGDFNIKDTRTALSLTPNGCTLSYAVKKYISHPSTKETLDYIMLPSGLRFGGLECIDSGLSDHCALIAEIDKAVS